MSEFHVRDELDEGEIKEGVGHGYLQAEQMLAIRKAEIFQGRFDVQAHRKSISFEELSKYYLEYF